MKRGIKKTNNAEGGLREIILTVSIHLITADVNARLLCAQRYVEIKEETDTQSESE